MVKLARLTAPVFALLLVANVAFAETQPPAPLKPMFEAAAAKYNVPIALLYTLAHFGSAFENRGTAPTIENGYGIMALRQNNLGGTSLAEAATLTSVSQDDLKVKPDANIMGAAAVLDSYAKMWQVDRMAGLDVWLNVIIKYAALDPAKDAVPVCSRFFAMEIYEKLKNGLDDVNSSGEHFSFAPQSIGSINLPSLEPPGARVSVTGYPGASWYPAASCNYTASSSSKNTVICHTIEGSAAGCLSWFNNCSAQVSSHYVVSEAGGVWQCVDEWYKAWHVGCANSYCIGIEHEGYASSGSHPAALYNASALCTRDICNRWGIPKAHNGCPPGILGHIDINNCVCGPGHTDPGAGWDWGYYINAVNGTNYTNPPYLFDDGTDGWAAGNSATGITWTGAGNWNGSIYFDQNGNDCFIYSPTTNFTGASAPQTLNVDFYPQSGTTAAHDIQLFWKTNAENSFTADKSTPLVLYNAQNNWATVNLPINNSKWWGQTVNQLRLDFDNTNHSTRYIINHMVLQNSLWWHFDTAGDVMGWTAGHSLSTPWQTSGGWPGCLVTDQTGDDAYMFSGSISGSGYPYNFIGGVNDWIRVRVYPQSGNSSVHDMAVLWVTSADGTWNDAKSCHVTYNAQNGWADVYLPVGLNSNWQAKHISQIRLDFDQANHGTRWIVDQISSEQPGSDATAPTVPTGLTATAAAGTVVNLSWTASTDSMGVNGYKVYRNGTQIATSVAPSYSDTSCSPETTYSYTVSAYDAVGNNSAQSSAASVTTSGADTQPPTVPQNLRRTSVTKSGLTIAWDASTDNIAVAGYRVYRNGTQIGTATGTSYSDSGLSANTGYTYQVDARDATPNYSAKSAALATGTAGGTWTRSNASQNCYTRSGTPDVVGVGGIAAGYSTTATLLARRGLVQWDMTGAPTQAETLNAADSVRVSLYQYTQTSATYSGTISLYKVNNDWNETNGTWNNVGLGAIYNGASVACVNVGDRTWSWNGYTEGIPPANRGVYVKNDTSETVNSPSKVFDNRTNIGGSGLPPRLAIDYIDLTAPSNCSISINSGAEYATSTAATLTLSATDTLSGMSQMQFSNDGTNYSAAEAYAAGKSYTLPGGEGLKTVYVKFMDVVGNWSSAVSDTITLDTVAPTISIGAPSVTSTASGPVTYEITYGGADAVTLADGDVTLNKTGTADAGSVVVSGMGLTTRTVTISGITGSGTLGISIAAGTASDLAGNSAPAAGPSATFDVANHVASYGLNNRAVADAIMGAASGNFKFTVWGKVTKIDDDNFTVEDGSSMPVKVSFTGHGLSDGDYASATGTLNVSVSPPVLTAQLVKKQN